MILMTSSLTCRDILASMPRGCYEETASVEYKLYRGGWGATLCRTEFINSSTLAQNFTFKTERTTTSRCDVSLQRGYRIGASVDVRFTLPLVSRPIDIYLSLSLSPVIPIYTGTALHCGFMAGVVLKGATPPVRGLAPTGPPNEIFGKCIWTNGMKDL